MHPPPADAVETAPSQGALRDAILDTLRGYCIALGATWTRSHFGGGGFADLSIGELRAACRAGADEYARRGLK